jgi:hypothetical protein
VNNFEALYLAILILAAAGSAASTARQRRRKDLPGFEVTPQDDDDPHRSR